MDQVFCLWKYIYVQLYSYTGLFRKSLARYLPFVRHRLDFYHHIWGILLLAWMISLVSSCATLNRVSQRRCTMALCLSCDVYYLWYPSTVTTLQATSNISGIGIYSEDIVERRPAFSLYGGQFSFFHLKKTAWNTLPSDGISHLIPSDIIGHLNCFYLVFTFQQIQ